MNKNGFIVREFAEIASWNSFLSDMRVNSIYFKLVPWNLLISRPRMPFYIACTKSLNTPLCSLVHFSLYLLLLNLLLYTSKDYDDIFVNCNWVVTRWQQYSTDLHTNSTLNDTKQTIHRTTQQLEECGPCPVLASYTLAFALQPRKKHGKTSVRVAASKNTWTTISIHRQR